MTQRFRLLMAKRTGWFLAVALVCGAFALKVLGLIDATSLWSDELYTVGKSFQPDYGALLAMLRQDTHPPLYYSLLWLWGAAVGQSAVSLRLLSWLAYGLGSVVMVAQARQLAPPSHRQRAMALAALLAFCSPYPVRFAIEGKSYELLVLLVALGWWLRSRLLVQHARHGGWRVAGCLYGLVVAAAGLTHFYGLFVFLAAAVWDGWCRRWRLMAVSCLGMLPAFLWIAYASAYLFSSRSASWIGTPDFALLEETLARILGPWPFPKLMVLALLCWVLRRWGLHQPFQYSLQRKIVLKQPLVDSSAIIPSLLMVLGVVALSFLKPMAFSRYFVVLLPSVIPYLAVLGSLLALNKLGKGICGFFLSLMIFVFWHQSFLGITGTPLGVRESDDFRYISQFTGDADARYSPRPRLHNLSDQSELAAGRLFVSINKWGSISDLSKRLSSHTYPAKIYLAATGPTKVTNKRMRPFRSLMTAQGFECIPIAPHHKYVIILECKI